MIDLMRELVPEDQQEYITKESVLAQLKKPTYYKDPDTGQVKLGLCYKQIRKEVKKNPYVTVAELKKKHKLG